jgi:hypothetical protein
MRPLVVFTGQGLARADGFNLTRRLKALPQFAGMGAELARGDRQNLDTLIETWARRGETPLADLLRAIRALCLKERRSTLRKKTHREVFAALAAISGDRVVIHLTACIDGLTTTFAVRDGGAVWLPFRQLASLSTIAAEAAGVLRRGTGFVHFPAHGEAPLIASAGAELELQYYFGDPDDLRGAAPWIPSLALGIARGLADIEAAFPPSRLAYDHFDAALAGDPIAAGDSPAIDPAPAADLLVIGYGADAAREQLPFERRIAKLRARGFPRSPARWTALVHRPAQNRRVAAWYEDHGFGVAGYDDGDLAEAVRQAVATPRAPARPVPEPPAAPPTRTASAS